MYPAFIIPACDEREFATRLSDAAKGQWFAMREIMEQAVAKDSPRRWLRDVAAAHKGLDGYSFATLQRRYYDVINGRDWRCLADMRKASGGGRAKWVNDDFLMWWRAECGKHGRGKEGFGGVANAHRELVRQYRAGATIGGVCWTNVWDDLHGGRFDRPASCPPDFELPAGWGYEQLCRKKPPKTFMLACVNGKTASKQLMAQVLTTRRGLEPGMMYAFDDLWHDFDVVWTNSQILRILELCCIDVASGYKAMALFRPRVRDEVTGKRTNLCEADMMLGVAHLLGTEGYHRSGCRLIVEGGTASLPEEYIRRLNAVTGGLVTVEWSKSDRAAALAAHWRGPGKGNPKGKRWVESSHNLSHNVLACLPGQIGPDSRNNKTDYAEARNKACQAMLDVVNGILTEEEAAQIRFPLLRYNDAVQMILEAYERIHTSRDHNLEGWEHNRKLRWRTNPGDAWHEMAELDNFDPSDRALIEATIRSKRDRYVEDTKLNRKEVWIPGRPNLARLAPHHAASLLFDLAKPRRIPESAEMRFEDHELEAEPMVYRLGECLDPAGFRVRLEPGAEHRFIINPFDASRTLHVMATSGQYVGGIPRLPAAALIDVGAVEEMVRSTGEAVNRQLGELKRIGLPLTLDRLGLEQHNLGVLTAAVAVRKDLQASASVAHSDARSRRRAAVQSMVAQ